MMEFILQICKVQRRAARRIFVNLERAQTTCLVIWLAIKHFFPKFCGGFSWILKQNFGDETPRLAEIYASTWNLIVEEWTFFIFFTLTTKKTFFDIAQASFETNFTECTLNFFNHFSSSNKWNYKTLLSGRVEFAVCGFCVLTLPFVLLIQFRDSTRQTDRLTTRGATNWQINMHFGFFVRFLRENLWMKLVFFKKTVRWQMRNADLNCFKNALIFFRYH